jgi:hypothetical protein
VALTSNASPGSAAIPALRFAVTDAEAVVHSALPTISFRLAIDALGAAAIRSILLDVQIQIAARARGYDDAEQERLLELFGGVERWGTTLRTLPWVRTTAIVPPFNGSTTIALTVPCSYDLEVSGARYLAALATGDVPLEFLFSGSVFFAGAAGMLQTTRISWNHEVSYGLPVAVWRQAIDRHFPGSAWLRLRRESFERLCAYKARHAFTDWDAAVEALLAVAEEERLGG